jgi:hypothetical protein
VRHKKRERITRMQIYYVNRMMNICYVYAKCKCECKHFSDNKHNVVTVSQNVVRYYRRYKFEFNNYLFKFNWKWLKSSYISVYFSAYVTDFCWVRTSAYPLPGPSAYQLTDDGVLLVGRGDTPYSDKPEVPKEEHWQHNAQYGWTPTTDVKHGERPRKYKIENN